MEAPAGLNNSYTILAAISLLSVLLLLRPLLYSKKQHRLPPGPRGLPLLGHLHLLRPPPHHSFHHLSSRYGPLISLRLGSTPCVVASSPDLAQELLRSHDLALSNRPLSIATRRFAYDSDDSFAFAPYGPHWRFIRKLCMTDLLGSRTLDHLLPIRRHELLSLLNRIKSSSSKPSSAVDVSKELIRMTNYVITRMVASTSSTEEGGEAEEARRLVKEVAELKGTLNVADHVPLLKRVDPQGLGRRIDDVHRRFDRLMERIIAEREEMRSEGKVEVKDMLDILMDVAEDGEAEVKMSRDKIKSFILDIFSAGSDSSAATLEWTLSALINHPSVLKKARDEIDAVVGKTRLVEESDIPNLPYIHAVIKETLRLHTPAPLIVRETTKEIHVGGYDIPAKTTVFVNGWALARDPKYWDRPLEFLPERFIAGAAGDVDVRGLQHFHYLPFGSGRRGCPGMSMALQVVHVTLAAMIQCFEWAPVGGATVDMTEGVGLVIAKVHPLVCVPSARLPDLQF